MPGPGIIDTRTRYWAAARLLRNTDIGDSNKHIIEETVSQFGYLPEVLNEFKAYKFKATVLCVCQYQMLKHLVISLLFFVHLSQHLTDYSL